MKALQITGSGQFEIVETGCARGHRLTVAVQDVDIPEPRPHEVTIDVELSWISNGMESEGGRDHSSGGILLSICALCGA